MAKRIQLPAIGGLRKSVIVDSSGGNSSATTISGFENQIVTLAQLRAALGLTSGQQPTTASAGLGSASLIVGPGLTGGGPLVGAVPIGAVAPPVLWSDDLLPDDFVVPASSGGAGGTTSPLTTKGDVYTFGTANTRLPVGVDGQVLTARAAATNGIDWETPAGGGGGGNGTVLKRIRISHTAASGTVGGSATASAWNTRTLNTIDQDDTGAVTLASNQFTLPAGTYYVRVRAPAALTNNHKIRLVNVTDSITYYGSSDWNQASTAAAQTWSELRASFTIAAAKTFEVDHYVNSASNGTQTLGISTNIASVNEIYTVVELIQSTQFSGSTFVNGNITPDSHPASPDANNDEFEGGALSSQWTWSLQSTSTATPVQGYLQFIGNNGSTYSYLLEPLTQTTTFKYRAKMMFEEGPTSFALAGLCLYNSANGHNIVFGPGQSAAGRAGYYATSLNGSYSNLFNDTTFGGYSAFVYYEIEKDATNIYLRCSLSGEDGTFQTLATQAISGNMGAATHIGFAGNGFVGNKGLIVDWIRRVDTGVTPNTGISIANPNINPDTHPTNPTAWDDEFEYGTAIDTTGARFSGANPWTLINNGATVSSSVSLGGLLSTVVNGNSNTGIYFAQAVPGSTPYEFTWNSTDGNSGFSIYNNSTWKGYYWGWNGGLQLQSETRNASTNSYSFNATTASASWTGHVRVYFKVKNDGTNLIFSYSASGLVYTVLATVALSAWVGSVTHIAIIGPGGTPQTGNFSMDWFRRTL